MQIVKNQKKGFTLIELIVSIAIFSILIVALMSAFISINKTYLKTVQLRNAEELSTNLIATVTDKVRFCSALKLSNSSSKVESNDVLISVNSNGRMRVKTNTAESDALQETFYNKLAAKVTYVKVSDTSLQINVSVHNPYSSDGKILYSTSKTVELFSMSKSGGAITESGTSGSEYNYLLFTT